MTYDPEWGRRKIAELNEVRQATAARVMAASAAGGQHNPDKAAGEPDLFQLEERCAKEFAASASLRAEFGTLERYAAFRRAEVKGLVRIIGRREA